MTAKSRIYSHLKTHGSITTLDMVRMGIARGSGAIHSLRQDGHNITTTKIGRKIFNYILEEDGVDCKKD